MNSKPATSHWPLATSLTGVPTAAEPLALAELLTGAPLAGAKPDIIVHVAASDRRLAALPGALTFFAPQAELLRFPAWDCMPYDRAGPLSTLMAERMRTLAALTTPSPASRIVLTTANAILQRLPPQSLMRKVVFTLRKGQRLQRDELVTYLLAQGYRRNGKAMEPGEFALRGSIIDIVPSGMSEGIRLDLFGDDIESIRAYDLLSQVTQGTLPEAALFPVSEVLLNEAAIERFRESYRALFGAAKDDPLYEAISQGNSYPGMEHWLPLFYERTETLFDYCPNALFTFEAAAPQAIEERFETIRDYYEARLHAPKTTGKHSFGTTTPYHPVPPDQAFLMEAGWELLSERHASATFSPFLTSPSPCRGEGRGGGKSSIPNPTAAPSPTLPPAGRGSFTFRPALPITPQENRTPFDQLHERLEIGAKPILLACHSTGSRERLQTLLLERGLHCVTIESWAERKELRGKSIGLAVLPLEHGFDTGPLLILSEQDVLGERLSRPRAKKKKSEMFLAEAANFAEGELVVHREHGIGRFEGLVTLMVAGASHDCLKLIYDGDDKLFLPVENIELVTRFGLEEEGVRLDKLGGASWQARKAKLKQRIKIAAEALLKTAAERLVKQGEIIELPTGSYDDFCARFPYVETEDQAAAITDTLEDLHSGRPMDRLICGDVGFGKTEVALRAAFVVAAGNGVLEYGSNGEKTPPHPITPPPHHPITHRQVAIIAPTTLLARQHYRNFRTRFEGFPVTVRQLSRMVPTREQKETREQLAEGKVDIVIGTHALLSKQIDFKNLGLLIVDEEQHFGVAQKEKLKSLKAGVHVLTLSATPIPRTLQMALTGVRDLSLITTPPVDRLAVRSFVMPFDPVVVREAILREIHRGGKCFVVTPRIKDIAELRLLLADLVSEARTAVVHGQMPASDLDKIMNDFYDGAYDLLLSTAIIESGLDIPTANTMIIHNAHLFGLSQLYQMRGRVGRGKIRAYAYFMLPHRKQITKTATRRLEVMQTLDTLGAGFTLASHDMDIRGFGNLVGEEQSGHIREVGIELYQQMLEEAVAALKKSAATRDTKDPSAALQDDSSDWSPQINLGISVLIPEEYVADLSVRLGLYHRIAAFASDADIDSFAAELIDRFGPMPEETRQLVAVLGIKLLCRKAGIERLDLGPKGAVVTFHDNRFANPDALLAYLEKNLRTLKARPDQKLVLTHEWKNTEDKLTTVKKLVSDIAGLAQ